MLISTLYSNRLARATGRNAGVSTSAIPLNNYGATASLKEQYEIFATAVAVDIASTDAKDTSDGVGARTVSIIGLDANWAAQTETLTLNGQTKVVGVKTWKRVFAVEVLTVGSELDNAGIIYVVATTTGGTFTSGVPATITSMVGKVLAGENVCENGFYTTPAAKSGQLNHLALSLRAQAGTFSLMIRDNATTDTLLKTYETYEVGAGDNIVVNPSLNLAEKTDVILKVVAAGATGIASGVLRVQHAA